MTSKQTTERKPYAMKGKGGGKGSRAGKSSSTTPSTIPLPSNKFVGKTKELKGHIYDVRTAKQSELFNNTTKKIANYAGRHCKEAKDISLAIENLEDATFTILTKPNTGDDEVNKLLLAQDVQMHIKKKSAYRQNQATMFAVV